MKEKLQQYLKEKGALTNQLPAVLTQVANSIHAGGLPERMKQTIAFAEIMLYAGHFRRHIQHWNGSMIPINAITMLLAASGYGKDRGVKEARRCFHSGYKLLEAKREYLARQQAEKLAAEAGEENPETAWKDYYKFTKPLDLFTAATNSAAFLDHVAKVEESGLGAGYISSSEFGSELQSNQDMMTTIKDISEMYDMGDRETKPLKDQSRQTKAIRCMSVNALLMSSPDNILYDDANKKKIRQELSTKLGRRSNFTFITEAPKRQNDGDVLSAIKSRVSSEDSVLALRHSTDMATMAVTEYQLKHINKPITVSPEVRELFEAYLMYNEFLSDEISKLYPISKIVRAHMQWKALKLAGAIAFFANSETIQEIHYIEAINFTELLEKDMEAFETELVKEPYELFVKYMHSIQQDGVARIGLHKLRKMGYIPTTGKAELRVRELVELASSYDKSGIHTAVDDGVEYTKIIKTNANGVSYKAVDNSEVARLVAQGADKDLISNAKSKVGASAADGYQYIELEFQALGQMLQGDYAYSPFRFANGKRGKDYVVGPCKWIALDIDQSALTDEECHELLQDFNHHIVRTSNPNNAFKFRVLLELDSYVELKDTLWKGFIQSISEHFALTADLVPKSQIFFSYSGRTVLSVTDKSPVEVKEHLLYANSRDEQKEAPKLTTAQAKAKLDDPRETFEFAYEAPDGKGSLMMYAAAKKAYDLGATQEEIVKLIHSINDYWVCSMDSNRLQNTILSQVARMFH